MVNTPFPTSLRSEAKKAAKILREFTIPSAKNGPDKIIPTGILVNAEGLAILTVAKIGFLVTARAGSGIVIAKLPDGRWSAPSAIGIAGLGGGFELGAEMTDFVIILNSRSAITAFSKGGNLTLGGNFTIAAGPLGRNLEGDIAVRSPAAIYTYSKTRGLFAGISVEGSALIERKDANSKFYGYAVRAAEILDGAVEPPLACEDLYSVLARHQGELDRMMLEQGKQQVAKHSDKFRVLRGSRRSSKSKTETSGASEAYENMCNEHSVRRSSSTYSLKVKASGRESYYYQQTVTTQMTKSQSESCMPSTSVVKPSALKSAVSAWDQPVIGKAIYPYDGEMECDLSFSVGDEIEILTRTDTQDDWWEGILNNKVGIFPANFVQLQ